MENTEQIVPEGNILMNNMADFNGVDDSDDFYYNSEESSFEPTNTEDLATAEEVDPQVFQTAVESEAAPMENIIATPVEPDVQESVEEPATVEETAFEPANEEVEESVNEEPETVIEEPTVSENIISDNLNSEDIDKMMRSENETKNLDDSYVLSNFDVLFDSLYNDVNGANNFISDLIEQKKSVNVNEANLSEMKSKLEKEKEEFAQFVEAQKQSIELEKAQCNEYVKNQRLRLQNEEQQFNSDCEATRAQLKLEEEKVKIANEKLEDEKAQFASTKEIEEEKLRSDREKFESEQEQFEKEKSIALERIKQGQKELQAQKEQFAKTKELEEKKLELESKNLSQSCARFKELVSQFNSGFQQLPGDKD